jgi:hypothetical protein
MLETPFPFMDVYDSKKLFKCLDLRGGIESSVKPNERYFDLNNKVKMHHDYGKHRYVKYKHYDPLEPVTLATFFKGESEPNIHGTIFYNSQIPFREGVEYIRLLPVHTDRIKVFHEYLKFRKHPYVRIHGVMEGNYTEVMDFLEKNYDIVV